MPKSSTGALPFFLPAAMLLSSCTTHTDTDGYGSNDAGRQFHASIIPVDNGQIRLEIATGVLSVSIAAVEAYIRNAADAVSKYYGRFPVPRLSLRVVGQDGKAVNGREYEGRYIRMSIGRDARETDLAGDWVATHEILHTAFPDMGEQYEWMNEGLSDYLEPVTRARIGAISPEKAWRDFVEGMPQGQPEPGDRGLDHTHTWGRTYWGGCTYWLLADIQIRQQTHNQKSLQDALRAILKAGGDGGTKWELARVFQVGDEATGVHVLRDLHSQLADTPVTIDLDALWENLGIRYADGNITFNDAAPLAGIRKAIAQPIQ